MQGYDWAAGEGSVIGCKCKFAARWGGLVTTRRWPSPTCTTAASYHGMENIEITKAATEDSTLDSLVH